MEHDKQQSHDGFLYVIAALAVGSAIYAALENAYRFFKILYLEHKASVLFWSLVTGAGIAYAIYLRAKRKYIEFVEDRQITNGKGEDSVFAGYANRKKIFINQSFRRMHAQVVGTTNAGKTESVIIPWAIDDIVKGRGLVLIDGKADRQMLNKLSSYAVATGRVSDFRTLSLSDIGISETYNPLMGQSVDQITEKIIHSFNIENEYYRTVQFDILRHILEIFREASEIPNFIKIRQALMDTKELSLLADRINKPLLKHWVTDFINMNRDKRKEMISGLVSNLGFFSTSEVAELFNTSSPSMNISEAMKKNQILYFQLPVLKSPILGKAVAKMVLQDIQAAVSERHASGEASHSFFSIYLDDFTEYLTPQFVSLLNKSRSANVGVVFAHQAVGDLEALGAEVKNQILTNSNLKIFMRTNEPESAEYFSKTVGTRLTIKVTKRQKAGLFGAKTTDDGSIREVEEFIFHPNLFKQGLGLGEAVIVLPHKRGSKALRIKFATRGNLGAWPLPQVKKKSPEFLTVKAEPVTEVSLASAAALGV